MRLRLLKLVVQPTFVLDDGDTLEEMAAEPIMVPASAWPEWATGGYAEAEGRLRAEYETDDAEPEK